MVYGVKTLFFDESGYTGKNLLDEDQPVFTLASANIQDCEAGELLKSIFPNYDNYGEFKFSKAGNRKSYQENFLKFSEEIGKIKEKFFVCVCEKKFFAFGGAVNTLLTPIHNRTGKDFFANGMNHISNNTLYRDIKKFCGEESLEEFVKKYHQFSYSPSNDSLLELRESVRHVAKKCPEPAKLVFSIMAFGATDYLNHHNFNSQSDRNDIQFLFMLNSIRRWRNRTKDNIKVVHDESKYFQGWKDLWEKFTSPKIPSGIIMDSNNCPFIEFPLRVTKTSSEDSKKSYSLQLCDIIAGLTARCWVANSNLGKQNRIDNVLYKKIFNAGLGNISMDAICFFPEFLVKEDDKHGKFDESNISSQLLNFIDDRRILRLLEISTNHPKTKF